MSRPSLASDFATQELPEMLETEPENIAARAERLINSLSRSDIRQAMGSRVRNLTLLDLKMIEASIVHSGFTPPANLVRLIDQYVHRNEIAGLTYEDIVLTNPEDDPRTFTSGEVRDTEIMFYGAHREIEFSLNRVNNKIWSAIRAFLALFAQAQRRNVEAAQALEGASEDLEKIVLLTTRLGKMPKNHFTVFRKYLGTHPIRHTKGPSGAFTAGIPLLELLFRGDTLPGDYLDYLSKNWMYLPKTGRKDIEVALQGIAQGWSLLSLWERDARSEEVEKYINLIGNFLDSFRKAHYGAVARQIPEAVTGRLAGTGGEIDPGAFLRHRIRTLHFLPFH